MDDLKTFAKSDREQRGLLTIVKGIGNEVKIEFGLEKCIKTTFERGKLTSAENINLGLDTTFSNSLIIHAVKSQ